MVQVLYCDGHKAVWAYDQESEDKITHTYCYECSPLMGVLLDKDMEISYYKRRNN